MYRGILNEYQESSKSIGARSAYGNQKRSGNNQNYIVLHNDNATTQEMIQIYNQKIGNVQRNTFNRQNKNTDLTVDDLIQEFEAINYADIDNKTLNQL